MTSHKLADAYVHDITHVYALNHKLSDTPPNEAAPLIQRYMTDLRKFRRVWDEEKVKSVLRELDPHDPLTPERTNLLGYTEFLIDVMLSSRGDSYFSGEVPDRWDDEAERHLSILRRVEDWMDREDASRLRRFALAYLAERARDREDRSLARLEEEAVMVDRTTEERTNE